MFVSLFSLPHKKKTKSDAYINKITEYTRKEKKKKKSLQVWAIFFLIFVKQTVDLCDFYF